MALNPQQGIDEAMQTRVAREAVEGSEGVQAQLQATRTNSLTSGAFTFDARSVRVVAVGLPGDEFFETDTHLVYYYDGSAWHYEAGIGYGSYATMTALSLTVADEGALYFVNTVGVNYGLWRATAGAFVKELLAASPDVSTEYRVGGNKIIGARKTGWATDPTGTLTRTTFDSTTVTLPDLAARVAALIVDLRSHGMINA